MKCTFLVKSLNSTHPYCAIIVYKRLLLLILIHIIYTYVFVINGPPDKQLRRKIVIIFLSISLNIYFGCSKAPSHLDGSFQHPQHMFWLRNKKVKFLITLCYLEAWINLTLLGIREILFSYVLCINCYFAGYLYELHSSQNFIHLQSPSMKNGKS